MGQWLGIVGYWLGIVAWDNSYKIHYITFIVQSLSQFAL